MSWTDERVEKLKELWSEGISASQIAKVLGGVTRNAVIGKVHRLGLSNRATGADETKSAEAPKAKAAPSPKPEPKVQAKPEEPIMSAGQLPVTPARRVAPVIRDATQPRAPGAPTPEEEAARATLVEIEKFAKKVSLLDLTERTCKWPIGDPTEENFAFCGLSAIPGKPYCEHHVAVAFQPMSSRRDRARARN
ncbi:MAG: GcrA family cell cycle regulator [Paracoccaceae bacterium]